MRSPALLLLGVACAAEPAPPQVSAVPGGVEVRSELPVDRVVVMDASGAPLASRRLQTPLQRATVPAPWSPGAPLQVEVRAGERSWTLAVQTPALGPASLSLQAPLGQEAEAVDDGDRFTIRAVPGARVQVGLSVQAHAPALARVSRGGAVEERTLQTTGERALLTWEAPSCAGERCAAEEPVEVALSPLDRPDEQTLSRFTLRTEQIPLEEARAQLALEGVFFPADQLGLADLVRPPDRVTLPSDGWLALLDAAGLGFRVREPGAPWAWQGVSLRNSGDKAINVVVRARILGPDGAPDPAFRPRLRDADDGTGTVSVLLRVPAGAEARAALPVFVDPPKLGAGPWTRAVEVTPLGSSTPLLSWSGPLGVSRGSAMVSAGLGLTLLAAMAGVGWAGRRMPGWLRDARTSELTTIALFGALSFSVSALSQLVSMGVSALLGPFSAFLTGILDDALRTALWAALITLLPRPGVVTLALVVGWLLRVLALGSMGPVDLLFVGSHVFWLESCLWLCGITRGATTAEGGRWREGARVGRALRLGLGFGVASALSTASGLAMSAAFYRLFYAEWYAIALVALPGFLYSFVAAGLATRFADALRRVEP